MIWESITDRQTGILNFDSEMIEQIRTAKIAVFGAGGNGTVLDTLARTGFQNFTICDFDFVEASNLNRLPFTPEYVGMPKVLAWEKYLKLINPNVQIQTHQKELDRHSEAFVKEIVSENDMVILNTSDYEANFVIARVCSNLKKRMVVGPGTANCWIVSSFTHTDEVSMETVGNFGTEHTDVKDVDYKATLKHYIALNKIPGRAERFEPGVMDKIRKGDLAFRSCKIFVSLVNSAQTWEVVKNLAVLRGLELKNTAVVEYPIMQIFDPFRGSSFYWNAQTKEIGIPNWLTDEISWQVYTKEDQQASQFETL
jgi:molybdopterin/thiamine biosynthesis adenylyltransferase